MSERTGVITFKTKPMTLTGNAVKVGDKAPNFKCVGNDLSEVTLDQLVAIGKKHNIPVMEDLGSGALIDLSRYGLPKEPIVSERIRAGADVVSFSDGNDDGGQFFRGQSATADL